MRIRPFIVPSLRDRRNNLYLAGGLGTSTNSLAVCSVRKSLHATPQGVTALPTVDPVTYSRQNQRLRLLQPYS